MSPQALKIMEAIKKDLQVRLQAQFALIEKRKWQVKEMRRLMQVDLKKRYDEQL